MKLGTRHLLAVTALALLTLTAGCSGRDPAGLPLAEGKVDPLVFDDDYSADVYFQAFFQTHLTAVSRDSVFAYGGFAADGARSLKFHIPPAGSALGLYTGGVLTSASGRDMAGFNALTFYARSDRPVTLDVAGFGNDNTGTSRFEAGRGGIPLTTNWTYVVVPIPASDRLRSERGMFTFAEATEAAYPEGYNIWIDEIRYARLDNIVVFRPSLTSSSQLNFVGSTVNIGGTRTIFQVDGAFVPVNHMPGYFDYTSSNPGVAVVAGGQVKVVGTGEAVVTATLAGVPVQGTVTVRGFAPPTAPAPAPTLPAGDVIALFSDAYATVPVDTWRADWGGSTTRLSDYAVGGDNTRMYSSLNFVGVDFRSRTIDASTMTHLHLDVYAPAGTDFKIELLTFPAGDPGAKTQVLTLNAGSTPAFSAGGWSSLDIPLSAFQLPASGWDWGYVGQMVFSTTDAQLVLLDNIYFHR